MNPKRIGFTLIVIALLTVGWYCICPKTTSPGVQSWKWTGDPQSANYAHVSNRVPSAESRRFWPGVAVIWPLCIGISFLGEEYTVQAHNGVVMLSSLAAQASATQKVILASSLNKTEKIGAIAILLALLQLVTVASKRRTSRGMQPGRADQFVSGLPSPTSIGPP
jgi:hypothetical protein